MASAQISGDADLAALGSVLGERARARMLLALGDGRALPAGVLASEAGVAASTASQHLGRLVDAGLLAVVPQGRHRYYRLAGPQVAELIEALARVAPAAPGAVAPRRHARARDQDRAHVLRPSRRPPRRLDHASADRRGRGHRRRRAAPLRRGGPAVGARARRRLPPHARGRAQGWSGSGSRPPRTARCATASTGPSRPTTSPARSAARSPNACSSSAGSAAPTAAAPST